MHKNKLLLDDKSEKELRKTSAHAELSFRSVSPLVLETAVSLNENGFLSD